jgi:prophage maintenance system killer protein
VSVAFPDLADYLAIAEAVTGIDANVLLRSTNKRAAWVTLRVFVEMNDWVWAPYPDVNEAEQAVLAVASSAWDEEERAEWLRGLLRPPAAGA